MKKPVLVIMAAGMGSRYGGLKQIDPVDKEGHIIMDFSIFDAKRAGFEKVVFIIKKENEADFKEAVGKRMEEIMDVSYVFQDLHNIPEGMAVGVIYAGLLNHADHITAMGAFSLALGIAIQNFPEGAIISMPLCTKGMSKRKAFIYGVLSGAVEPVASVFTVWAASLVVPVLPYFLSFAAGAMIYVVVEELVPKMSVGETTNIGIFMFAAGFSLMMILDVALG